MCKHLRGHIANTEYPVFSSTVPAETGNGQNWMALLAMSLLMKDGPLLFPFLAGLPYQILSSSPVCCWIFQFSATGGLSRITHPSCGAAHPMPLLAMTEHSKPLVSHKLALTLDPALLFSIYTSIFKLNNVSAISAQCPVLYFLQNFMDKIRSR